MSTNLNHMWNGLEQLHQFGKAIVGHTALPAKVVMVGWYVLAKGYTGLRAVSQQVNDLTTKLGQLLVHQWAGTEMTKLCNAKCQ